MERSDSSTSPNQTSISARYVNRPPSSAPTLMYTGYSPSVTTSQFNHIYTHVRRAQSHWTLSGGNYTLIFMYLCNYTLSWYPAPHRRAQRDWNSESDVFTSLWIISNFLLGARKNITLLLLLELHRNMLFILCAKKAHKNYYFFGLRDREHALGLVEGFIHRSCTSCCPSAQCAKTVSFCHWILRRTLLT